MQWKTPVSKSGFYLIVCLFIGFVIGFARGQSTNLIVMVNDVRITQQDITRYVNMMAELLKNKNPKISIERLEKYRKQRRKALSDQYFQRIVLEQGLMTSNIVVTPKIQDEIKRECKRSFGRKGQTFEQLYEVIGRAGYKKDFDENLKRDYRMRAFLETTHSNRYYASKEDLANTRKRLNMYNLRAAATNRLILAHANSVVALARAGTNFVSLVEKYSQDDDREASGSLGDCDDSDFVSEPKVWQDLCKLKPGSISDVMEVEDGYAIYRIDRINTVQASMTGAESITLSRIFFRRAYIYPPESDEDLLADIEAEKRERLFKDIYWQFRKNCRVVYANKKKPKGNKQ